jgi:hypothetical protein
MSITDAQYDALWNKLNDTHDRVLELSTRFNGGPGSWPACQQTVRMLEDHEKRLRKHERVITATIGAWGFVMAGIAAYSAFHK